MHSSKQTVAYMVIGKYIVPTCSQPTKMTLFKEFMMAAPKIWDKVLPYPAPGLVMASSFDETTKRKINNG